MLLGKLFLSLSVFTLLSGCVSQGNNIEASDTHVITDEEEAENTRQALEYLKDPQKKKEFLEFCHDLFDNKMKAFCVKTLPLGDQSACGGFLTSSKDETIRVCQAISEGKTVSNGMRPDGTYGPLL